MAGKPLLGQHCMRLLVVFFLDSLCKNLEMSWQSIFKGFGARSANDIKDMESAIKILKENVRDGSVDGLKEYHRHVSQTVFIISLVVLGVKLYIADEISQELGRNRKRKRPRAIVVSDSDSDDAAAAPSHAIQIGGPRTMASALPRPVANSNSPPKGQAPRKRAKLQKRPTRSQLFGEAMQGEDNQGYGLIGVLNKENWTHSVQLGKYMGPFDSTIPLILQFMKSVENHGQVEQALSALVDALNERKMSARLPSFVEHCKVHNESRDVMDIDDMHAIVSDEDTHHRDTQNAYLLHIHASGKVTLLYSNKRDPTVPDGDGYLTLEGMTVAEIQRMLEFNEKNQLANLE